MERRRSQRVDFQLKAESTLGNINFSGSIENLSYQGLLKIIPNEQLLDIIPGTELKVSFKTPSGKQVILESEVRWVRYSSNMPVGVKHHVGMEIKNPPQEYTDFMQTLYNESYYHSLVQSIDLKI
jgi:hypothetical protein